MGCTAQQDNSRTADDEPCSGRPETDNKLITAATM